MSVRKNVRSTMKEGSSRDQEFLVSVKLLEVSWQLDMRGLVGGTFLQW